MVFFFPFPFSLNGLHFYRKEKHHSEVGTRLTSRYLNAEITGYSEEKVNTEKCKLVHKKAHSKVISRQ